MNRPLGRRLAAVGLAGGLVTLAATAGLGYVGYRAFLDSRGTASASPSGPPASSIPDTPAMLLVQVDASHKAVGLTVFVRTPTPTGGWVIDIPVDVTATMPDQPVPDRLAAAYDVAGLVGEQASVEALLQVSLSGSQQMDTEQLAAMVAPFTPVTVSLSDSVPDPFVKGKILRPSGRYTLTSSEVAQLLTMRVPDEKPTAVQSRRRELWRALLGDPDYRGTPGPATTTAKSIAQSVSPTTAGVLPVATTVAGQPSAASFLEAIRSGPHRNELLPVWFPSSPDGVVTMQAERHTMRLLIAKSMPGRVSPTGGGTKVRVIDPLDEALLVDASEEISSEFAKGFLVMAGTTTAPAPDRTIYEYSDDTEQEAAQFLVDFLGPGDVVKTAHPVDGIDVTVTLGKNYAARIAAGKAAAASRGGTTTTVADSVASDPSTNATSSKSTSRSRTTTTVRKKRTP